MAKRKLKTAGRKKAFFGAEAAAILAAAGINAATQLAAAGINSSATKQAAKEQANAALQSAQRQSQAIKDQTEKSKENQQQTQEFVNEQNAENRELQKDIQMQLQMLTGQQNVNDRLEASKIKVKNGGCARRKLYNAGNVGISLRGSGNMPFTVTDGGGVLPIGTTPEGFELYEIVGNDHEHYHKTRGGKHKSGVGIKFATGQVIEGEGNQNGKQGEYLLSTPNDALFISKHSIAGFNPAKSVNAGMHPLEAYQIQETLKAMKGISDDGKHNSSPVKKIMGGTDAANLMFMQVGPQLGVDTVGDTAVGVAYGAKPKLRNGGRCRRRAVTGINLGNKYWDWTIGDYVTPGTTRTNSNGLNLGDKAWTWSDGGNYVTTQAAKGYNGPVAYEYQPTVNAAGTKINTPAKTVTPASTSSTNSGKVSTWNKIGNWVNNNADLVGAGIASLGNIGGALITAGANRSAARTLSGAYTRAADTMAEAYRSLTGIDPNALVKRENYAAAHAMPALQAPVSFAANKIAEVDRSLQRRLTSAGKYSASGAAAQERMARAEVAAQDARNQIYSEDAKQMQQIRQANAERVTQAAMLNAQLDTEANKQFSKDYIDVLKYNNDIDNMKILGAAGALSEGDVNAAGAISQGQAASANAWANAFANSGLTFSNTLSSMAKRRTDLENTMLGATTDARINYLSTHGTREEKRRQREAFESALASNNLSASDVAKYRYYIKLLS